MVRASGHYREECVHGLVGGQCRCMSPDKQVRRGPCDTIAKHDEALAARVRQVAAPPAAQATIRVEYLLSEEYRLWVDGTRAGDFGAGDLDRAGAAVMQALLARMVAPGG